MKPFEYSRPGTSAEALATVSKTTGARYLGGGTNLLDLMKDEVMSAPALIDLTRADFSAIRETAEGLSLGASAKNSDTANHPLVRKNYPLLSQAMLAAASAQIRNMATNGGNILQRTRCPYFYDTATPCNKRVPGSGCGAVEGLNRMHAIFGASEHCVAVHPSDMAVALVALDARVRVIAPGGTERVIPIEEFHRLPGDHPERDSTLEPGELIVSIDLPPPRFPSGTCYLKIRDRASYAFALVSVAAAVTLEGDTVKDVRLVLGGVAHKPWPCPKAEAGLKGEKATTENFEAAAATALAGAKPLEHNEFKIILAKRAIVRALQKASGMV